MKRHENRRFAITTLAAIAAATIAFPATAYAAGADYHMQSPPGNIICEFGYYGNQGPGVAHVDCYISDYAYPAPINDKPSNRAPTCPITST